MVDAIYLHEQVERDCILHDSDLVAPLVVVIKEAGGDIFWLDHLIVVDGDLADAHAGQHVNGVGADPAAAHDQRF